MSPLVDPVSAVKYICNQLVLIVARIVTLETSSGTSVSSTYVNHYSDLANIVVPASGSIKVIVKIDEKYNEIYSEYTKTASTLRKTIQTIE